MYYLLILLTFLCKRLEYENGRSIGCTCFVFYFTEINYIIIIIIIIKYMPRPKCELIHDSTKK